MPQTRGRIFDDFAKLMTDAAGMAHGARREAETAVKTQFERVLATMNVVTREEFEAVREMAALAREENDELRRRITLLESKLRGAPASP
ncbi:MAG TPA: accessory factor UbiK family protein [Lichenihabitans sp.]|jgi:BMFP domain-containing protein YqiC|nr:accessory factor UbiK family protein [Lichenihabitans sp.]